jgi:hypothetical protein
MQPVPVHRSRMRRGPGGLLLSSFPRRDPRLIRLARWVV